MLLRALICEQYESSVAENSLLKMMHYVYVHSNITEETNKWPSLISALVFSWEFLVPGTFLGIWLKTAPLHSCIFYFQSFPIFFLWVLRQCFIHIKISLLVLEHENLINQSIHLHRWINRDWLLLVDSLYCLSEHQHFRLSKAIVPSCVQSQCE